MGQINHLTALKASLSNFKMSTDLVTEHQLIPIFCFELRGMQQSDNDNVQANLVTLQPILSNCSNITTDRHRRQLSTQPDHTDAEM